MDIASSSSKRVKSEYLDIDKKCVNTIRVLGADMVQKANSGHPGLFIIVIIIHLIHIVIFVKD